MSESYTVVRVKCPRCGTKNRVEVDSNTMPEYKVMLCYPEDGGCDKRFVAKIDKQIEISAEPVDI